MRPFGISTPVLFFVAFATAASAQDKEVETPPSVMPEFNIEVLPAPDIGDLLNNIPSILSDIIEVPRARAPHCEDIPARRIGIQGCEI
ncbi:MAG: hypothetical protein AAF549_07920 [Pseudomonadota bacterium]